MNKDDIEKYLRMLGEELLTRSVTGEILLVGGAVMLLEVGNREITKDIDAYFEIEGSTMKNSSYRWHRQTIAETFERISSGITPRVAIGDFLDDWRRSSVGDRLELVEMPIASAPTPELQPWAAFCAAMVEWLCWQDNLPIPAWTGQDNYRLSEPWFLYDGKRLRAWQLVSTPTPFKMRNIYGGDRMLDRA